MQVIEVSMRDLTIFALIVLLTSAVHLLTVGQPIAKMMPASDPDQNCSEGWRITGYYTPVETDFDPSGTREIEVLGPDKQSFRENFNPEFLSTIFSEDVGYGEGWGKTRFGWYLGQYDGAWHKSDAPLDANDRPLEANTVAVDHQVIPRGSLVRIPDLPGGLGELEFISNDVGVSVHGKHIDVYTGEGREAGHRMYAFTYEEDDKGLQRVCFVPPQTAE
jgi:3D (Asp-Asp-Asp) domain-containing protein